MHAFDTKELKRLFGIPASQIRALIRAGHINPVKKAGRFSYSFQDLIVLRTAGSLRAAKIPAHRINRTLREIRASLPSALPLSGLSIVAVGDRIHVREGRALRESESGQYALALEVIETGGDLKVIDRRAQLERGGKETPHRARGRQRPAAGTSRRRPPPAALDPAALDPEAALEHFQRALELEDTDAQEAQAAYEAALASDPRHLEARLNLGRLLHLEGRLEEAESVYRASDSKEALLAYNLAVLLEDLGRDADAIASYREALALDPRLADAHYNLALLYERGGRPRDALKHLLAYRRLSDAAG